MAPRKPKRLLEVENEDEEDDFEVEGDDDYS